MPILFADKRKRYVAAIHCGRKGLENGIIRNSIKIFDKIGSHRKDIVVAIGPSISKENYLVDKKTLLGINLSLFNQHPMSKNSQDFGC